MTENKYFVLVEFPYEGVAITKHDSLEEAEIDYQKELINLKHKFISGVAIIHGKIIKSDGEILDE